MGVLRNGRFLIAERKTDKPCRLTYTFVCHRAKGTDCVTRSLVILSVALALSSCAHRAMTAQGLPDEAVIAGYADVAMRETGAKGLAIAVIDNGHVRSVQSFGDRNTKGDPLTTESLMYGASLTKTAFGYLVMQLSDEGVVDLDQPIAALLPKPLPEYGRYDDNGYGDWADLAEDPRWQQITPRMILQHSTGFANFSFLEPDQRLHIHFDPGTRYSYSGDGIILLQFALEKGLGLDVEAEMQRRFFAPLGMKRTSLIWNPKFAPNLADGWKEDGTAVEHDQRGSVRAAGSMDTTIGDLAKFVAMIARAEGLSEKAADERIRPGVLIDTLGQFPTLQDPAPDDQRIAGLAAGMGVVTFTGPQGSGWFKGGHNDWTANTLVCLEKGRRCVLILANDVRAEAAFPTLVREILGETGVPFEWEYRAQYGF